MVLFTWIKKWTFANLARAPTDPYYFPLAKALKLMINFFKNNFIANKNNQFKITFRYGLSA